MLRLEQIRLTQFKNHPDTDYSFHARVVGITGPNGVGKTNLLDAIHTLCFARSYFTRNDQTMVRHGENGFRLDGRFLKENQLEEVEMIWRETGKKEVRVNKDPLPRRVDLLGRYPVVMIAPDDAELIQGDSKLRRQFLDALICQLDSNYLSSLSRFNKILAQRQVLLREWGAQGSSPARTDLLNVLDEQFAEEVQQLVPARQKWITELQIRVLEQYERIAGITDKISMRYAMNLEPDDSLELIRSNRARDLAAERNTVGPHRDELVFSLNTYPFKLVASQGQRKTLLFALKLAACQMLEQKLILPPLLLLDDIFEKLDAGRTCSLLRWLADQTESQVFISDTDPHRLASQLGSMCSDWQLIQIPDQS